MRKAGRLSIYGQLYIFPLLLQLGDSVQRFLLGGASMPLEICHSCSADRGSATFKRAPPLQSNLSFGKNLSFLECLPHLMGPRLAANWTLKKLLMVSQLVWQVHSKICNNFDSRIAVPIAENGDNMEEHSRGSSSRDQAWSTHFKLSAKGLF